MKSEAVRVLEANSNGQEGSFIYYLHEKDTFHEDSYWELYHAMIDLIEATKQDPYLERGISATVSKVFSYIYRSFMWNFCPHDQYSIRGLPDEGRFPDRVDRLEEVFSAYFNGISVNRAVMESDIPTRIGTGGAGPCPCGIWAVGPARLDQ